MGSAPNVENMPKVCLSWNVELSLTRYNMDEYEYDDGWESDLDNWETEEVFQDHEEIE